MELVMRTDLDTALPAEILFNHEELKLELAARLGKYKNLVVTEDGIKDAKADKAGLNRLKTALEDKRKEVKKSCLTPYEGFERMVKELVGMIDDPIRQIDSQIKAFDEARKQAKLEELTKFYQLHIDNLAAVLPLKKVLSPKWSNAGESTGKLQEEMADTILQVRKELRVIEAMKLACETQVKDAYLRNLNMSEALAEKTRFEEQEKRLGEIKQRQADHCPPDNSAPPCPRGAASSRGSEPGGQCQAGAALPEPGRTEDKRLRTVRAVFYGTTPEFRAEMNALIAKYEIRCEAI